MIKPMLAAALAAALLSMPVAPASAATAETKPAAAEKKPAAKPAAAEKKLTPQQQKMKDCAAKWGEEKKAKNVKGRKEYNKFMSGCLKKKA